MSSNGASRHSLHVLDPSYAVHAGHHGDINAALLQRFASRPEEVFICCDQSLPPSADHLRLFRDVGYRGSEQWWPLPVSIRLARKINHQLSSLAICDSPPRKWIAHSLLPFQLLGFTYVLAKYPPSWILISLMFDPTETLSEDANSFSTSAKRTCLFALLELARVCRRAGHQLRFGAASQHTIDRYRPLLERARLTLPILHPAFCGAGCELSASTNECSLPLVLLHWGDLKFDKGWTESLTVVQALLDGWKPSRPCRFLFHSYSSQPLKPHDLQLLQTAKQQLAEQFLWINRHVAQAEMQSLLSQCELVLMPYSPLVYAHRTSGVLWCYAAARFALGRPATVVGYANHWLHQEAMAFGMQWHVPSDGLPWHIAIDECIARALAATPSWSPYANRVLKNSYADWVVKQVITSTPC